MGKLLWTPSEERVTGSNMYRFMTFVNGRHQQQFTDYDCLYAWSVSNIADFWADVGTSWGSGRHEDTML